MNKISYIAIHHSGGIQGDYYRTGADATWQGINDAHRERWDFISSLGYYGGYNLFIQRDGTWKQFRAVGEETAAQIGYNFNTISICLAGNFSLHNGIPVDTPSPQQIERLKTFLITFLENKPEMYGYAGIRIVPGTEISVTPTSINPHRFYQPGTECNGTYLKDNWGRSLIDQYLNLKYANTKWIRDIYSKIVELTARVAGKAKLGSATDPICSCGPDTVKGNCADYEG